MLSPYLCSKCGVVCPIDEKEPELLYWIEEADCEVTKVLCALCGLSEPRGTEIGQAIKLLQLRGEYVKNM